MSGIVSHIGGGLRDFSVRCEVDDKTYTCPTLRATARGP